jgi:hypothetical protein
LSPTKAGIADNDGSHLGDVILTKTGLIWCKGRLRRENGTSFLGQSLLSLWMLNIDCFVGRTPSGVPYPMVVRLFAELRTGEEQAARILHG